MNRNDIEKRVLHTLKAEEDAISRLREVLTEDFYKGIEILTSRKGKILVTGVGKSGFIAQKMVATLISLGHDASFLSPLDALHGDSGMVRDDDILIVFSFSGASPELVRLVNHFKRHFSIQVITITGNRDSVLVKLSDSVISFDIEQEGCPLGLAPMASTTASLVIADSIASALTSPDEFKQEHFARFHPAGSLGLSLKKVKDVMVTGEQLPIISEDALLNDAIMEITVKKRGIVGVVNIEGVLVGVITDGDLRRIILNYDEPKNQKVKSVMTKTPKVIFEDDSLKSALRLMKDHQIMNVFVVYPDGALVGLIHMHHIVEDMITFDAT